MATEAQPTRSRGKLRVYLGAAPGVGKTYAMLGEGRRRCERGTDVVVGFVETHGRQHTAEMLEGLEVVPRSTISYRGSTYQEMDVDAVLARRPQLALVDELAHTNVPGSRNAKRWQDVQELLDAGIDVITTVNIQHLESVNDVVEKITGVPQRETVPDAVVRAAEQIELEDMTAEALRRRLAHGNVYAPEKVDAALANYFRVGNLNALRELALLWTADRVDAALQQYREQHDISGVWEARERVVVALSGGTEGETLLRRAARIAVRSGGDLLAVHVARSDGLAGVSQEALTEQRRLVESLGGSYHQVLGDDVAESLLTFARAENATQLVLGDSRRTRLAAFLSGPGIGTSTIRQSGDIDVHIVTHRGAGAGRRLPRLRGSLSSQRVLYGYLLSIALPVVVDARPDPHARRRQPGQRHAAVPADDGHRRARRRRAPGAGLGGRWLDAPQLLLHAAPAHADDPGDEQRAGAVRLRRGRDAGQLRGRPRCPAYPPGRTCRGRVTHVGRPGVGCAG